MKDIEVSNDYIDLTIQAKVLYTKTLLYRLKIAKLASKACTIRHGGRSDAFYTLKDFHRDTGIPYKSLQDWVTTYNTVGRFILSSIKTDIDWSNATKVSQELQKLRAIENRNNGTIKSKSASVKALENPNIDEIFTLFEKQSNGDAHISKFYDSIKTAHFNIKQVTKIDSTDQRYLMEANKIIDDCINRLNYIDEKTKQLIKVYYETTNQ